MGRLITIAPNARIEGLGVFVVTIENLIHTAIKGKAERGFRGMDRLKDWTNLNL